MGEEVKMTDYECAVDGEERVTEWEAGLPGAEDLVPLSQSLVSPVLAFAFSITPEPCRSILDVNRASQNSLPGLRERPPGFRRSDLKAFDEEKNRDSQVVEGDDDNPGGGDSRIPRRIDCAEEADSAPPAENPSGRAAKRPRLVWTPQLHKRFVDVVAHLGIKNAVPKTIMQLMNVDGLTRENVASHLQKYRLYLKRIQGVSSDGPSASDQLFASTSLPHNLHESGGSGSGQRNGGMSSLPIPMPYGSLAMPMPMPAFGLPHGHAPMAIPPPPAAVSYHGFDPNGMLQQRDWPRNKFGSTVAFPHPTHNDK